MGWLVVLITGNIISKGRDSIPIETWVSFTGVYCFSMLVYLYPQTTVTAKNKTENTEEKVSVFNTYR